MRVSFAGWYGALVLSVVLAVAPACVGPSPRRHAVQAFASPRAPSRTARPLHLLVAVPQGYAAPARTAERWPLVLYLHGILAEGRDPASVTREGLPRALELGFSPPALVASPQLPAFAQKWTPEVVTAALDAVIARYRVDPDRVVLFGISSGASTGWEVLKALPDRFAGFVSLAGWSTTRGVERIRHVPVWGLYGALDFVAPAFVAARGVRSHLACGGRGRMTQLPWVSHWIPSSVYTSPALWAWILAQRRTERNRR